MKTPHSVDRLSLFDSGIPKGPYPPLGFVPVFDAELGNGDYFGLYWPLGRESEYPVVCEMYHDEWSLALSYSSTEKFVEYLDANDGARGEVEV